MSRYQKYHLSWPLTPTQVNNLDDMLGSLFKALADQGSTSTAVATVAAAVSAVTAIGPPGIDGEEGVEGPPGIPGQTGPRGVAGIPGPPGEDAEEVELWPQGTTGAAPLSGVKVYFVADTSGGAVTRKLTFQNGLLISET